MNTNRIDVSQNLRHELQELTRRTLSPRARYAHLLLLMAASCMGVIVLSLLLTEPGLPRRTQVAFGMMLMAAFSWILYAGWTLRHRRPLMQAHRVVAAALAVVFSSAFTLSALLVAVVGGAPAAWVSSGLGGLMLLLAVTLLGRARQGRQALLNRCDELRRRLRVD